MRSMVAGNVSTPTQLLMALAKDQDKEVRWRVANNVNTPLELLTALAADEDPSVRSMVAGNVNTPAELITVLATDESALVRWRVANNVNTPAGVLTVLATDWDKGVRGSVAGNVNTPIEGLTGLATDEDSSVRRGVASNVNSTPQLLTALAEDKNEWVSSSVAGNANSTLELLVAVVEAWSDEVLVSSDPYTTEALLASVDKPEKVEARAALARGPYDPELPARSSTTTRRKTTMEQTPFSDKVRIIAEAYHDQDNTGEDLDNFYLSYDLGAPLCVAIYNGGATANDIGVKWIEKAWEGFCEVMKIDKYGKYDSWDEILEFLGE